ncbi:MAG: hypothetical protein ABJB86_22340 [Bacteroidota bacterium]
MKHWRTRMNNNRIRYVFAVLALFVHQYATAQVFSNGMSALDKVNVYKVVTFEEFIHRFNNDVKSNIRMAYRFYKVEFKVRRPALIRSLFDYETKAWDTAMISNFATAAIDTRKVAFLDQGANLLAEAVCRFRYGSADIEVPVVLHYISDPEKGSKWVIVGVGHHPLSLKEVTLPVIKEKAVLRFINPVNNEANFTELSRVFDDKENLQDYFDHALFLKPRFGAFYNAVLNSELQFLYVKEIRYHALQYENWIFTVKEFRRNTLNSGWLISKLLRVNTPEEKNNYIKTLMGE